MREKTAGQELLLEITEAGLTAGIMGDSSSDVSRTTTWTLG